MFEGELVRLRPLEPRDYERIDLMESWIRDEEVTQLMFTGLKPTSMYDVEKMWVADQEDPNTVVFSVFSKMGHAFIGTAGLYSINWIARTAEFRIFIGNKYFWGQGRGTDATKLVVEYGFKRLRMHNVWLGVNEENKAAIRVYEKVGFRQEGLLREAFFRNSRYYNLLRMSLLRREWECTERP